MNKPIPSIIEISRNITLLDYKSDDDHFQTLQISLPELGVMNLEFRDAPITPEILEQAANALRQPVPTVVFNYDKN